MISFIVIPCSYVKTTANSSYICIETTANSFDLDISEINGFSRTISCIQKMNTCTFHVYNYNLNVIMEFCQVFLVVSIIAWKV